MPRRRINDNILPLHTHHAPNLVPQRQRVSLNPPDQGADLGPAGLRAEVDGQPVGAGARDEVGGRGGGGLGRRGDGEGLEEGAGVPQAEEGCGVHCEGWRRYARVFRGVRRGSLVRVARIIGGGGGSIG